MVFAGSLRPGGVVNGSVHRQPSHQLVCSGRRTATQGRVLCFGRRAEHRAVPWCWLLGQAACQKQLLGGKQHSGTYDGRVHCRSEPWCVFVVAF